jgi:hypothetical protein
MQQVHCIQGPVPLLSPAPHATATRGHWPLQAALHLLRRYDAFTVGPEC